MDETTKAEIRQKLVNIEHLRELLFGEQVEEFEKKIDQHNQRLNQIESDLQELKSTFEKSLEQLENKILCQIDTVINSLEEKIKNVNNNTQAEQQKIKQELDTISKHGNNSIEFLQNSISDNNSILRLAITQSKAATDRDLQLLKRQLFEQLESHFTELSSGKLSRSDLAEVLFELCLKLQNTKGHFELINDSNKPNINDTQVRRNNDDFMLPEKS